MNSVTQSVLVIVHHDVTAPGSPSAEIIGEFPPDQARVEAEKLANAHINDSVRVGIYRLMGTYKAEVKITFKADGE